MFTGKTPCSSDLLSLFLLRFQLSVATIIEDLSLIVN